MYKESELYNTIIRLLRNHDLPYSFAKLIGSDYSYFYGSTTALLNYVVIYFSGMHVQSFRNYQRNRLLWDLNESEYTHLHSVIKYSITNDYVSTCFCAIRMHFEVLNS